MNKITKQITIDGSDIAVTIRDQGADIAWVFLHGWGSQKEVFQYVTKHLPITTVAVDLPGFGNSSDLTQPLNTADYSRIVNQLIQKLNLQSVVLVGHSFGGQVAVRLAAQQPDWLTGLVLVGAAVIRRKQSGLLSRIGGILSPLFQLPLLQSLRAPLYQLIGADQPPADKQLRQTMRTILREDQQENLKQITVPTRVIWGDGDQAVPLADGRKIVDAMSSAYLTVLPGGHYIFVDAADAFCEELLAFHNQLQS